MGKGGNNEYPDKTPKKAVEFMNKNQEFMNKNQDLFEQPFHLMRYYPRKELSKVPYFARRRVMQEMELELL